MKSKVDDKEEYTKSLLKCENDELEEKMVTDETSPLNDVETNNPDDTTPTGRDKTSDVIFLDASKSNSDCVILDIAPSSVTKLQPLIFDDSVTPHNNVSADEHSLNSNTPTSPTKAYLDTISLSEPYCRVCHCTGDEQLISPCHCSGSVKWVHETCLVKWMKSSFKESCELCRKDIEIAKRRKPLSKWKLPSQRPTPVLWVLVFITAIALNLASVVKDASRQCSSTPCIVFYAVGCIGVVLGTLFLIYWSKRAKHFVNHWLEQNEEWVVLLENMEKRERRYSSSSDVTNTTDNTISLRT